MDTTSTSTDHKWILETYRIGLVRLPQDGRPCGKTLATGLPTRDNPDNRLTPVVEGEVLKFAETQSY